MLVAPYLKLPSDSVVVISLNTLSARNSTLQETKFLPNCKVTDINAFVTKLEWSLLGIAQRVWKKLEARRLSKSKMTKLLVSKTY